MSIQTPNIMSDSTSAKPELQGHAPPTIYATPRSQRGFWALIATQFQGAFSDNVLRYLLLGIVVGAGISEDSGNQLVSVIMLLFSLPFILFSMSGGYLADRYSKRSVTIGTKFMEIGSMLIATVGLALHSLPIELLGLALVATQAALFGPSKYGLLPELLPEKRLSWGNGIIELGTFLAIITGTVTGGVPGRSLPRSRGLRRIHPAHAGVPWCCCQSRYQPCATRLAGEDFPA